MISYTKNVGKNRYKYYVNNSNSDITSFYNQENINEIIKTNSNIKNYNIK